MYIEVQNVNKKFLQNGKEFTALDDVSLSIEKGEFICLLGPSGCGKSTLLNAIAGFDRISSGSIKIDGKEVTEPSVRNVMIFQHYGLLPWRNIQKNVELGLESQKDISKEERAKIAEKYIELVGLSKFKKSYPKQLSGGMQQRVSIARALAVNPDILFMDEPFGALDAITRMKLQDDRIVVMTPNPGKIKSIVTVRLGRHRDRTSGDFLKMRDRIFDIFHMKPDNNIEYVI